MANRFGKVYWKRTALLAAALVLAVSFSACKRGGDAPQESSGLASVSAHDPNVFPEGASIGGKNVGGKTVEEALPIARAALEETMETELDWVRPFYLLRMEAEGLSLKSQKEKELC